LPGIGRLLRGSAIYAVGSLANRLVALLLLPVFTAYLHPSEFGVLAMLVAMQTLLVPLFSLGLGTSIGVCYFNTADVAERRRIIWSAAWLGLAAGAALALAGLIGEESLSRLVLGDGTYAPHTAWAVGNAALGVLSMPWQLKLQFEERPGAFVTATVAGVLVTAGMSLWLVIGMKLGAIGALAGAFSGHLATLLVAVALAGTLPAAAPRGRHLRELLRHGVPMVPSFLLLFLLQQGVRWPLGWQHGLDAVGIYSVGASFGGAMALLTAAFANAWTPFALGYAQRTDEAPRALGQVSFYYVAAFGLLTCLFFLFAVPLVLFFANETYRGAAGVVGLSAASHFFLGLFGVLLPPLYFAKRVGNVVVTQLGAAVVACVLAWWLIPPYGVLGAGATVALAALALVVLQWAALRLLPVVRISYDYGRIGALVAVFACVGWLSFGIRYTDLLTGAFQAAGLALVAGIAVYMLTPRLPERAAG
jgi:O-antigen/teichoic acid export membrane protein